MKLLLELTEFFQLCIFECDGMNLETCQQKQHRTSDINKNKKVERQIS